MAPFEQLRAWQEAHQVVLCVYRASDSWPSREQYGLTSQARRAAFSVAANIAEGVARRTEGEFRHFLNIAVGSTSELAYTLRVARDLGLLSEGDWDQLEQQRNLSGKLLWRLYRSVRRPANK
jgi:four helix bundle protein